MVEFFLTKMTKIIVFTTSNKTCKLYENENERHGTIQQIHRWVRPVEML